MKYKYRILIDRKEVATIEIEEYFLPPNERQLILIAFSNAFNAAIGRVDIQESRQ